MFFPVLLILLCGLGVLVALMVPGWIDLMLIAGPGVLAAVLLLLRAFSVGKRADKKPRSWVVLDGSNIMYWKGGTPKIETVREVVLALDGRGMTVGVMFDANAGHLLFDRYTHDRAFAILLGLPTKNVMVVPKGTPADPYTLDAARELGARIVSNDRFRDWIDDHPEVAVLGQVVRGGYRKGRLVLDFEDLPDRQQRASA